MEHTQVQATRSGLEGGSDSEPHGDSSFYSA